MTVGAVTIRAPLRPRKPRAAGIVAAP